MDFTSLTMTAVTPPPRAKVRSLSWITLAFSILLVTAWVIFAFDDAVAAAIVGDDLNHDIDVTTLFVLLELTGVGFSFGVGTWRGRNRALGIISGIVLLIPLLLVLTPVGIWIDGALP